MNSIRNEWPNNNYPKLIGIVSSVGFTINLGNESDNLSSQKWE